MKLAPPLKAGVRANEQPKLASPGWKGEGLIMDQATRDLLTRTDLSYRANGERKLAHSIFMQLTWGLLGAAALAQLFLLVWLDVTS